MGIRYVANGMSEGTSEVAEKPVKRPSGDSAPIALSRPMCCALEHQCHARLREDFEVACSFA